MKKHTSFTKIEQDIRPNYRNNLNIAATTEDVKKFFVYAVQDFFDLAFAGRVAVDFEDIVLDNDIEGNFTCSPALLNNAEFKKSWENSDLPRILGRLAKDAINRLRRLEEKRPDKTDANIYRTPSQTGRFFKSSSTRRG